MSRTRTLPRSRPSGRIIVPNDFGILLKTIDFPPILDRAAAEISPQLALELEEDPQHFGDGEDGLAARDLEEQRLPLSAGTSSRASASRASTQAAMQAQEGIGGYADGDILFS